MTSTATNAAPAGPPDPGESPGSPPPRPPGPGTGGGSDDPSSAGPGGRSLSREVFWLVPVGLVTVGVTLFVLFNRQWGADAAARLGLPVSLVGIVVAVLIDRGVFRRQTLRVPGDRRKTWRWAAAGTALLLASAAGWWWNQREGDPFDFLSGTVRIGYTGAPAAGWHSERNGVHIGFDPDVARAIQDHFRITQIVWVNLGALDNRMAALRGPWKDATGEEQEPVKLVLSNFSMTPPRAKRIDFAGPYFVDTQGFLTRVRARTIADLPVGDVCVLQGSTGRDRLKQYGWNPVERPTTDACVNAYINKEVDAVSGDRSILAVHAHNLGHPPPLDLQAGSEQYGVGLPNNMPRLCAEVSTVLDSFLTYQWDKAFATNLAPLGLKAGEYSKPQSADPCDQPAPWYDN